MINNVLIESQDNFGRGVTKVNNKVIFVEKSLPGDICDIEIINDRKNYSEAKVVKYIESSIVNSNCCYYDKCGGCNLLHQSYEEQLLFKENKIKELVKRILREDIKVNNIVYDKEFNYRNKIVLHIRNGKLGFYSSKTNSIVEVNDCLLANNKINKIIQMLRKYISLNDIKDNEVLIRVSDSEELVSFKNNINDDIIDYLDVSTIIVNGNIIKGTGYIVKKIDGYQYKVSDKSFFQVNDFVVNKLYNEVINICKINEFKKVLDLYSGTGTIGIALSKYVDSVIGIEVVEDAVIDANHNKQLNSVDNAEFIAGKVEDYIEKFNDIDLIVVDPPRAGLDNITINNLVRINPKVICYVSCDPNTLMRDLNILKDNYFIESITPFDMFPNTYHVECVCVLKGKY